MYVPTCLPIGHRGKGTVAGPPSIECFGTETPIIGFRARRLMTTPPSHQVLAALWRLAGQPPAALDAMELTGAEPVLPSSFAVGTAAQATVAASALAAAELWRLRTGRRQQRQRRHARRRDRVPQRALSAHRRQAARTSIATRSSGLYRCGDGRWVRLHTNLPHHRAGTLKLLGCDYDRASVQRALDDWEALRARGRRRRRPAWSSPRRARSPNGTRIRRAARSRACRCSRIEQIGDAPPQPLPAGRSAARRHQGAGPDARDRRPGVRAHARGAWRRRAADHRRASAGDGSAGDRQRTRQARRRSSICAMPSGRETLAALLRRGRHFRAGLPAGRHRPIRLQRRGSGAAAARHRLRLALRLRPRRAVGGPARLRLAGAERQRPQRRRGARRPAPASRSRCRPRRSITRTGYPDGVRRDDGAQAPRHRRRKLARALLAGADRRTGSAGSAGSTGSACPDPSFDDVQRPAGGQPVRLRPADRRAPLRRHVGDAAALGRGRRCRSAPTRRSGRASGERLDRRAARRISPAGPAPARCAGADCISRCGRSAPASRS